MLGIYDISEAEKEFVISRKLGEELTGNAFYRKLENSNRELAERFKESVAEAARLLEPSSVYVVSDVKATKDMLISKLVKDGLLIPMNADYPNSYLYRSDPSDVARSEKDTYICTSGSKEDVGPTNNWIHTDEAKSKLFQLLRSSLNGKTMYVIPYWLGPKGSAHGQGGIQVTDSLYVVVSLLLMVRCGEDSASDIARSGKFVFGIHSTKNLDPKNKYICHFPEENEGSGLIISVNSNYGGNALLSKKCHALRIASTRARNEGWLAEHMMMIGVKSPSGEEVFISAAFPSASGKTNLSMLDPPEKLKREGWKTSLISDDIIW
ncbi:Phosphoenolpyruvate carboxykinase (GTP), partial [mine drainage metagenome]